jgi:TPP-dependent 2-oxoacid decarboxylase
MNLTGGQIIARALKSYGVSYVAGIPGHGCWAMLDALLEPGSEIPFIQVMHEQSAVHIADGYYRARMMSWRFPPRYFLVPFYFTIAHSISGRRERQLQ